MTLKTSLFSKAIFKENIKRFMWGSILYFIILFVSSSLSVLLSADNSFYGMEPGYFETYPIILGNHYMGIPIILSIIVPTVVSLMAFRFIHSKSHAIFIHSLPATRKSVYISTLAAAFTLMFVPIIANGIILIIISCTRYGIYFTSANAIEWVLYNMLSLFMMFSCAVLSSTITGNSFALIIINILVHSFTFVAVSSASILAETFLYGYSSNNAVFESIVENNFAVVAFNFMQTRFAGTPEAIDIIKYISVSIVIYISSYFIYSKRSIESAGDIAAFRILNHIFKYTVTLFATMITFGILQSYISDNPIVFTVIVVILSVVSYAAIEMLLKKSMNILSSWKGYAGFIICFFIITWCFAFTSFFGYETRVPEINDIQKATLYSYYYTYDEPYTTDEKAIEEIRNAHHDFLEYKEIPKVAQAEYEYTDNYTYITVGYELKNGNKLSRRYAIPEKDRDALMGKLYENQKYKEVMESVYSIDESLISRIFVSSSEVLHVPKEVIQCLREDIYALNYKQIHSEHYEYAGNRYNLVINCVSDTKNGFVMDYNYTITPEFTKTYKLIEEFINNKTYS